MRASAAAARTAWEIVAASLASFALARLLPAAAPEGMSGLRGMLVVLPVVAALFASVSRRARPAFVELALWAGWLGLALHSFSLGIPGLTPLVAGAGLALAGVRTARLVLHLRRGVTGPGLWPVFALPLALYLFAWPWATTARAPDGDEPYYLLLTQSLATDGDVDLANEYRDAAWKRFSDVPIAPQPGDPVGGPGHEGAIYSRHSALLPAILAPLYRLAGPYGAQLGMLLLAAGAAAAGFAAARARFAGEVRSVVDSWTILAFAPPLLLYAGQFWVEVPAALLLALALRSLARLDSTQAVDGVDGLDALETSAASARPARRDLIVLALALLFLPLLKLRFLALTIPLGALAVMRLRRGRENRRVRPELFGLLAGVALALVALGAWNFLRYGNPLRMYAIRDLAIFDVPWSDQLRGDFGLFFDAAFGLFALSPIWLLLLPGLGLAILHARRRDPTHTPPGELLALVPYLLFVGMRREWYGGWSPPFRYGVVLLPALALLLPPLFVRRGRQGEIRRGLAPLLVPALALSTTLLAMVYLIHPAWSYSLADGSSRLLDELARSFAHRTGDWIRLFPSMARPRRATWLVPLVATVAMLGLATWRSRARSLHVSSADPRNLRWPAAALALLLGGSALALAAQRLPTSRLEFEDAGIEHSGGALYPERWTVDRTRFSGGWVLRDGAALVVRPIAGGALCQLKIRALPVGLTTAGARIAVRDGAALVASLPVPASGAEENWVTLETAPFPFMPGDALRISLELPEKLPARRFVVLDRADVEWR